MPWLLLLPCLLYSSFQNLPCDTAPLYANPNCIFKVKKTSPTSAFLQSWDFPLPKYNKIFKLFEGHFACMKCSSLKNIFLLASTHFTFLFLLFIELSVSFFSFFLNFFFLFMILYLFHSSVDIS
jgi:hypothetical protein